MRYTALLILIILFSFPLLAQTPETDATPPENNNSETKTEIIKDDTEQPSVDENAALEKESFEKAVAVSDAAGRISALQKFIANFPESVEKTRALELIVGARAEIAAEKLRLSETAEGIELFKLAVREAPTPVSDKLFSGILLQIPTNVFLRGERVGAFDIAKIIEGKIGDNPKQLLGLATFYLGIEYSTAARQLAEKALALDPESAPAFQTLGLAYRVGFNLPKAAESYEKALELDPDSAISKRSLAEMKRALGETATSARLYRELLEKDSSNVTAKTGLILSLFNNGDVAEAETLMTEELQTNPKNVPLLVGASYWYATRNNGEKAIDLATQALKIEPRYTWGYIALARGYMKQNKPLAAESALIAARQFGNFPTISYEIALAQNAAGFYKEAAEELKKAFTIEDGKIVASLGGRVVAEGDNFIELLSLERKAGIFESNSANDLETAETLKKLLVFENKLDTPTASEFELAEAAENFAIGEDAMKTHRHLFVANRLLEKKKALPKALELTRSAVGGVESALKVSSPSAAVLADELYETRTLAKTKGQNVVVPDIPAAILSRIIRGRIEETAGWTFYEQSEYEKSLAKLNLAMSILPKDSAWWRSALWKRGQVLSALEKPKEALDSYIQSYASEIATGEGSTSKQIVVEALYTELNGSLDGLKERLAAAPKPSTDSTSVFFKKNIPQEKSETPQNSGETIPKIVPVSETNTTTNIDSAEGKTISDEPKTSADVIDEKKNSDNPTTENLEITSTQDVTKPKVEPTPVPSVTVVSNPELPPVTTDDSTDPKKPTVITEDFTNADPSKSDSETSNQSSIFSPIIIAPKQNPDKNNLPVEETENNNSAENKNANQNPLESSVTDKPKIRPKITSSNVSLIDLGATRPRIVQEKNQPENINKPVESNVYSECKITVSQEVVSIPGDGGSVGILIGLADGNDINKIRFSSSSPEDIQIAYEPENGSIDGQAFFVIKSVSPNKGAFTTTFDTPCGKKEILVKVR